MSDLPNDKRDELRARVKALEAIEAVVLEYVTGYDWLGEDDSGREGHYSPTEQERALIADAIAGLHADDDFVRAWDTWRALCLPSATRTLPSEPQDWPELGDVAGPPNEPAALVAWISTAQTHGADELVRRMQKRLLLWEKAHLPPDVYERINGWPIYVSHQNSTKEK